MIRKTRPRIIVQKQPDHRGPAQAGLRAADRQRHRQAAADQHDGVDRAQREVQLVAALGPRLRVPDAIQHVGQEEAAEEHDLGDQEQPHAERGSLVLLPQRVEVMLERRMVVRVRPVIAVGGDCLSQL